MDKSKVWQPIIDQMIESLEKAETGGVWEKPWIGGHHINAVTGKSYRSMNSLSLSFAAARIDCEHSIWATYQQWKSIGAQVKQGAKGTALWSPPRFIKKETEDENSPVKMRIHPSIFYVFNASQVDNYTPPEPASVNERLAHAETFLHRPGASIVFADPDSAYYRPSTDTINMPKFEQFTTLEMYYSVLAHELVHWTGHSSRLNRGGIGRPSPEEYAEEELVAEFGSAMISSHLGIVNTTRDDHLSYLSFWLQKIRKDPDVVQRSVVQASKAFNYIDGNVQTEEQQA